MKPLLLMKRTRSRPVSSSRLRQGSPVKPGYPDVSRNEGGHTLYDKNMVLARESLAMGDRVLAESYYQQAEHYLRMYQENRGNFAVLAKNLPQAPAVPAPRKNDFENSIEEELASAQIRVS